MTRRADANWAELIRLPSRYQRSIHLERDLGHRSSIEGYRVTPLVRSTLARIARGLEALGTARAWSITGPYGSGKSAFGLFLTHVLGRPDSASTVAARKLLEEHDTPLRDHLFSRGGTLAGRRGLIPVITTAERLPLDQVLLRALRRSVEEFWSGPGAKPSIVREVAEASEAAEAGRPPAVRDIVHLFTEVADKMKRSLLSGDGLLVILDEAGKVLEFAAQSPTKGDIHLLQELAEAANRSGETPIVFLACFHQSFEHYAGRLNVSQRNEWAKVQGRFEDIVFQEASDQVLRLIGAALDRPPLSKPVEASAKRIAADVSSVVTVPGAEKSTLTELLLQTVPLHPLTALVLGPLFRSRFSQNERSLFAFLASSEPHGFREFLAATSSGSGTLYPIDRLYDYVLGAFGDRLFGHHGRQWAQVEEALRRLPAKAGALEARLVKVIGIIAALGDAAGVPASEAVLSTALSDGSKDLKNEVRSALKNLQKASIIIYRKFRDAHQLWDGSDLDIDDLVQQAIANVDRSSAIIHRLERVVPPRPMVARRHLFGTGTLRCFGVHYIDETPVDAGFGPVPDDADGQVFFVIPTNSTPVATVRKRLQQPLAWAGLLGSEKPVIVALPSNVERLRELATEIAALENVQTNTPRLQGDAVARREVDGRIAEAEGLLRTELENLISGERECTWFVRDKLVEVRGARELARLLSDLCDAAYYAAPVIHNELLNRRNLSSAAAAARRTLMQAMIERQGNERLGFEGFPPEVSMYRSVLEAHGLHRKRGDAWAFGPPAQKGSSSMAAVHEAIVGMLSQADDQRIRLDEVYRKLKQPPFGLKDGPLPVLVLAAILELDAEIALYEDGAFVPALTGAVVERLLRGEQRFELQRYRLAGSRLELFKALQSLLKGRGTRSERDVTMLPVVRELVRFVRSLPEYCRNTQSVSERAQAVREAILKAKEPGPLIFEELPSACELPPFKSSTDASGSANAEEMVGRLRAALRELSIAYGQLLDVVEAELRQAFELPNEQDALRRELGARAKRLLGVVGSDLQLKGFLVRVEDDTLPRADWLVSVATLFGGKPPETWYDRDVLQMRTNVGILARRFRHLEATTLDGLPADLEGATLLRLSITRPGEGDRERVVAVRDGEQKVLERLCDRLRDLVRSGSADLSKETMLAGFAIVARELIADGDRDEPHAVGALKR